MPRSEPPICIGALGLRECVTGESVAGGAVLEPTPGDRQGHRRVLPPTGRRPTPPCPPGAPAWRSHGPGRAPRRRCRIDPGDRPRIARRCRNTVPGEPPCSALTERRLLRISVIRPDGTPMPRASRLALSFRIANSRPSRRLGVGNGCHWIIPCGSRRFRHCVRCLLRNSKQIRHGPLTVMAH